MEKSPAIKAITISISAFMLFSAVGITANAAEIDSNTKSLKNFQINTYSNSDDTQADLPTSFSSVDYNIVNPPKDQRYNDCWIHS